MSGTTREVATLGGGCFWCIEAVLERLEGVEKVVSGYSGGHVEDPSYEMVCSGQTGHAEVVQVTFDPSVLSYRDLLVVFFAGYLVENREMLAGSFVRLRHLGPLFLAWGASIFVMVFEKDLGSSLLLFGVFVAMLYMATNQAWYLFGALILFVLAVFGLYTVDRIFELSFLDHVQVRIDTWHNPWADAQGDGPVDATFKAIESLAKSGAELLLYSVNAVMQGTESQGEVTVRLSKGGRVVNGVGADTDIIVASAKAYISALNRLASKMERVNPQHAL